MGSLKKKELITPFKVKIIKADNMLYEVFGEGYAKNQFSNNKFVKQKIRGIAHWYEQKIGEEWDVLLFNENFYRVNNEACCGFYFIHKLDCILV